MRRLLLTPLILSAVGCTAVAEPPTFVDLSAAFTTAEPEPAPAPAPEPVKRVQRIGGATVYAFDPDETYKVRVTPGRLTVLQLGKGEELAGQPVIGDQDEMRWVVNLTRGANDSVVVSARQVGISTNLFVTTTGGDYQIDLVSVAKGGMNRVRWIYPKTATPPKPRATPVAAFDPTAVQASFKIGGDTPKWRPKAVTEYGGKTYIEFPPDLGPIPAAPALFAVTPTGKSAIHFRVKNGRFYEIDQRINVAELVLDGQTVNITRGNS